jgi:hypothetical protein
LLNPEGGVFTLRAGAKTVLPERNRRVIAVDRAQFSRKPDGLFFTLYFS